MSTKPPDQPLVDWRDSGKYAYLATLTRDAWAWEFLRRNPAYRTAWADNRSSDRRAHEAEAGAPFGLVDLEDPDLTALEARLLWQDKASSFVLPLHVVDPHTAGEGAALHFATLCEGAARYRRTKAVHHLLFLDEGRRLQVAIRGGARSGRLCLFTQAPLDIATVRRRSWLMQRLAYFHAEGRLAPSLYPPDPRSRRLALVLQALDGWLNHASQQTIAQVVFPNRDVHADWRRPTGTTLRHQIRRMIQRGRWLMAGAYLRLLL